MVDAACRRHFHAAAVALPLLIRRRRCRQRRCRADAARSAAADAADAATPMLPLSVIDAMMPPSRRRLPKRRHCCCYDRRRRRVSFSPLLPPRYASRYAPLMLPIFRQPRAAADAAS